MAIEIETDAAAIASHLEESLPTAHYLSPEIFQLERDRIFFREWYCVGREEQLPNPGNYLAADVVGESVLVVRTKEGRFRQVREHKRVTGNGWTG